MQDENPYRSPQAECFVEPVLTHQPLPASSGKRFANMILDQLACGVLAFVIGILGVLLGVEESIDKVPDLLFGIVICLIYYIPLEAICGKTLAKYVTGTKVVSETGARPTFGQIVGRTFCRMIPFEPFSFLFGGSNPVGWHDSISKTRVILDR